MPFVLDASVAIAWYFQDEVSPYADAVLERLNDDVVVVPAIWPLEVANALLAGERRGRLSVADTARVVAEMENLPITVVAQAVGPAVYPVLDLARAYRLTAYDASYLDLARREGLPLATQDGALQAAARDAAVDILE